MSEEVKDKLEEEIQEQEEIKEEVENVEKEGNELEKIKAELEEYKKAYAIKMADFQNFSKRKEKELQDFKEYAAKDIILKVLENLDNLERAQLATNDTNNMEALIEGLNMSVNNFKEMLKHEGVEEIEAQDKIYDATEHHAITTISDKEKANNTVVFVSQKGYKLKGRVIRPSMVVINKIEEENK
ncbi:nucleotide exchange factor GrpE [Pseudostreptobacillus sp.]